ncbi:hypothetical protein [Sinomicrobium weinanense]|uniref:Uncharacterized protein n=1 Tax=Sinomicrobium weinanense TaxID=2842200 RepID=A0A926JUL5_9FLAO|nr:hypothetical protein [Sinomicrobium weinanense]MBC9797848.1 hypothetical protein [Sinomicrobium weinanense]MBU3122252.1 hypothetical protein [Sinomicrobium weinanense]
MRLLSILWAALFLLVPIIIGVGGCSASKERHTESRKTSSTRAALSRRDSLLRRDTLVEWYGKQLRSGHELLSIAPVGDFTYHPDSGFSGQASKLVVYREQTGETATRKGWEGSEAGRTTRQQADIRKAESGSTVESRESQTDFRFPWWWGIGALVLGVIVLRYFRKVL